VGLVERGERIRGGHEVVFGLRLRLRFRRFGAIKDGRTPIFRVGFDLALSSLRSETTSGGDFLDATLKLRQETSRMLIPRLAMSPTSRQRHGD
jgi:hypothetical protein